MKNLLLIFLMAGFLATGCSSSKNNTAKGTYKDFKNWVSNTTSSAADKTEDEWKELKRDYKNFTDKLDKEEDKLEARTKEEYRELKRDYKQAEANAERRFRGSSDTRETTNMKVSAESLLGDNRQINNLNSSELHDAYQAFMNSVRDNMNDWTNKEWEEAEKVYQMLEKRRDTLDLSTTDAARIRILQGEYQSLKSAHRKL